MKKILLSVIFLFSIVYTTQVSAEYQKEIGGGTYTCTTVPTEAIYYQYESGVSFWGDVEEEQLCYLHGYTYTTSSYTIYEGVLGRYVTFYSWDYTTY